MTVSIEQAAQNALCTYLRSKLNPGSVASTASATLTTALGATVLTLAPPLSGASGNALTATVATASDGNALHFNLTVSGVVGSSTASETFADLNYSGTGADSTPTLTGTLLASIQKVASGRPANGAYSFSGGADGVAGTVTVAPQWPAPERKLPDLAVTVLQAGDAKFLPQQPEDISSVAGSSAGKRLYRWLVAEVTVPLQLDCWSTRPGGRSDLRKRVTDALYGGRQSDTYPIPGAALSLTLALADGWTAVADYTFDGFTNLDSPEPIQQAEYRAIAHGEARAALYIDAETPRLARIILQQTIDGAARPDDIVS